MLFLGPDSPYQSFPVAARMREHFGFDEKLRKKATHVSVFAKKTVRAILKKKPPRHFICGHLGFSGFLMGTFAPLWFTEKYLMKTVGLNGTAATHRTQVAADDAESN